MRVRIFLSGKNLCALTPLIDPFKSTVELDGLMTLSFNRKLRCDQLSASTKLAWDAKKRSTVFKSQRAGPFLVAHT